MIKENLNMVTFACFCAGMLMLTVGYLFYRWSYEVGHEDAITCESQREVVENLNNSLNLAVEIERAENLSCGTCSEITEYIWDFETSKYAKVDITPEACEYFKVVVEEIENLTGLDSCFEEG